MHERLIRRDPAKRDDRDRFSHWVAFSETDDLWLVRRRNCEGQIETEVHAVTKATWMKESEDCSDLV